MHGMSGAVTGGLKRGARRWLANPPGSSSASVAPPLSASKRIDGGAVADESSQRPSVNDLRKAAHRRCTRCRGKADRRAAIGRPRTNSGCVPLHSAIDAITVDDEHIELLQGRINREVEARDKVEREVERLRATIQFALLAWRRLCVTGSVPPSEETSERRGEGD